jgi:hypothetical protein
MRALVGLLGMALLVGGIANTRDSLRCHQKGVVKRSLLGERVVRAFAEYADLRYSIDSGTFHLLLPGEKSSALDLACSAERQGRSSPPRSPTAGSHRD